MELKNDEIKKRMRQNRFVTNNGMVLRAANALREKYVDLSELRYALELSLTEAELTDCINYLSRSGFVELRDVRTHEIKYLSDADFEELEAIVTPKGVQLLNGRISDPCITV